MSTNPATKSFEDGSSRPKSGLIVVFYMLTFIMGGLFLFAGGKMGLAMDVTASTFYLVVTVLFYVLSRGAHDRL